MIVALPLMKNHRANLGNTTLYAAAAAAHYGRIYGNYLALLLLYDNDWTGNEL